MSLTGNNTNSAARVVLLAAIGNTGQGNLGAAETDLLVVNLASLGLIANSNSVLRVKAGFISNTGANAVTGRLYAGGQSIAAPTITSNNTEIWIESIFTLAADGQTVRASAFSLTGGGGTAVQSWIVNNFAQLNSSSPWQIKTTGQGTNNTDIQGQFLIVELLNV